MNRLGTERSPYLLQHAANPVDWFPWGEEAFARAREEQKPIFLSVGYSTCHWCHVMEHESFENADVARVLNDHFVAIKVDREERPDVDRVYMAFVQATTGSGGWPMSVWLTPDLKPFYGGTYFPPSSRWGRPGFVDILQEIARVWNVDRDKVRESADEVTERLRGLEHAGQGGTQLPGATALERTVGQFKDAFDPRHAGFGGAPKFPRPSELLFLLREFARTGDGDARDMAAATLRAMLYDQAQLVLAYVEASQALGDPALLDVAEDTLRYVMREMTDQSGGFYSAEDADSVPPERAGDAGAHKSEGAFYLWRADELDALLGADAAIVKGRFGVERVGNAPSDPQQEFTGKNLLYAARTLEELAQTAGATPRQIADVLERARLQMFAARLKRPRPHLDDKVLTAWNGLMIAAFARTARVARALGRDGGYLLAARKAASFIRATMWDPAARVLLRRYRAGQAEIEGYAEDYAYLIYGVVELFQADPRPEWLEWAVTLQDRQDELFWDARESGWFSTTGRDPSILMRAKEDYDGAEPAASSVAVENLLTLAHLVDRPEWRKRVDATLTLFGPRLDRMGRAVPMMAAALSRYTAGPQQLVVLEDDFPPADSADSLTTAVARRYLPFATVLSLDAERQAALAPALPFIGAMNRLGGRTTAYVCRDFACAPPATSVAELERRLNTDATY
jgi:uncharacterized protein YyaL (SSP411 family)